jgi:hypothetical protein
MRSYAVPLARRQSGCKVAHLGMRSGVSGDAGVIGGWYAGGKRGCRDQLKACSRL